MTVAESQDTFIRALCIWREMRGESNLARLACYWVISNRMTDPQGRWPKTVYDVVTQPYQFSSFNHGDPNAAAMPHKGNSADWQAWLDISGICDNPGPDPTDGANMYEALGDSIPKPGWVPHAALKKIIGNTRFYRL